MSAQPHVIATLSCGVPVLIERNDAVASAAIDFLLPVGIASDPLDGYSIMLSEYLFRGAGELDSREHSDALDRLGIQRGASVGSHHFRLSATMVGHHIHKAIPLFIDVIRRPLFPEKDLEAIRSLCLQSLQSLDDDPRHLVMIRARERHLPEPFNRTGLGDAETFNAATRALLHTSWFNRCLPRGTIISVAGDINTEAVVAQLDELLAGWTGGNDEPVETAPALRNVGHIQQDSSQAHIAMIYDAPVANHPHSMLERLGVHVLGQSTSGRLFTEVRQKRSLCYSVGASYRAGRDRGRVSFYAGTTPERAQETLDVSLAEIQRLQAGVSAGEFHRAVIGLKSALVMAGESIPARGAALAGDWFRFGRTRTLADVAAEVDAITLDALNTYLADRRIDDITLVALGPNPLNLPAITV
jgi:predicted Zn-dependent peptidase